MVLDAASGQLLHDSDLPRDLPSKVLDAARGQLLDASGLLGKVLDAASGELLDASDLPRDLVRDLARHSGRRTCETLQRFRAASRP